MNDKNPRFVFVGDVSLAGIGPSSADAPGFPAWPAIREAIGKHDFLVGNLECCLVDHHCSDHARAQSMAAPVESASVLKAVGFTDMCLANNHMLDGGPEAIRATRACLEHLGIRKFGAGSDLDEAEARVLARCGERTVAFLGACDASEYFAGNDARPGIAPLDRSRLGRRVRAAAAEADLVVVTLHADLEFSDVPGRWRQRLSRWLIRQGAHLVIQHHPHVMQGVEAYEGGLIAYSLGNFAFRVRGNRYQENHAGALDSAALVVDVDFSESKPKLAHRLVPLRIGDDHWPCRLTGSPNDIAMRNLRKLSDLIADKAEHRRSWWARCRKEAASRAGDIYYALRRGQVRRAGHILRLALVRSEDRRWIRGLLSLGYR